MNDTTITAFDQNDVERQRKSDAGLLSASWPRPNSRVDWACWKSGMDWWPTTTKRTTAGGRLPLGYSATWPKATEIGCCPTSPLYSTDLGDERFVTARHCLQGIWKVGVVGQPQQQMVNDGLAGCHAECITEKNGTLIRYDIVDDLRKMYDDVLRMRRSKTLALEC